MPAPVVPLPRDASGAPRADRVVRAAAVVVAVVLGAAALKLARPVLVPLVGGVFLAVLVRPIQVAVRGRLPRALRWLGLVTAMLVVLAGVGGFGTALVLSGRAVAGALQDRRPTIDASLARLRTRLARVGVNVPALPGESGAGAGGAASGQQPRQSAPSSSLSSSDTAAASSSGGNSGGSGVVSTATRVAAGTLASLGALLLALAFCALGLAEAGDARGRLMRAVRGRGGDALQAAVDQTAHAFRRYLGAKSVTSLLTGTVTTVASFALGLPLAWVWGFLAFLLEYIPSVGSVIAVLPPTLMALAEGGAAKGLTTLLVVGGLQVVMGNVVDPKIEGRLMTVSPFVVLLSVVTWGWLWGAVGALLAVPMTVAVVIAARHVRGLGGVATVLSGDDAEDG